MLNEYPGLLGQEAKPVFIIGSYRSGTSVLTWAFGQHPNLMPLPETNWMARAAQDFDRWYDLGAFNEKFSHFGWAGWSRDEFYRYQGNYLSDMILASAKQWVFRKSGNQMPRPVDLRQPKESRTHSDRFRHMRSREEPKARWVDGTPEYSHYVGLLLRMFPAAKFVHVYRDPVGVAMSLTQFSRTGAFQGDFSRKKAFTAWHNLTAAAWKAEQAWGSDVVMRVSLKELLANPETGLTRCMAHVGEEYSPFSLLPLEERINSSKITSADREAFLEASSLTSSRVEKSSETLFETISSAPEQAPNSSVQDEVMREIDKFPPR